MSYTFNHAQQVKLGVVTQILVKNIKDQLGLEWHEADLNQTYHDFGADSLDLIEILMFLEEDLEVEIPDDLAESAKYLKITDIAKGLVILMTDPDQVQSFLKEVRAVEPFSFKPLPFTDLYNHRVVDNELEHVGTLGDITVEKDADAFVRISVDGKTALYFHKDNSFGLIELLAKASK